jgi:hypothetical protein
MQALAVAGGRSSALSDGARYLAQTQKGDGGWTLAGGVVNSQSTAWAIQGLVAAHGSGSAISKGISYLARRQAGDGHYAYSAGSDQTPVWVTAQALSAVARKPLPLGTVPRAPRSSTGDPESGGPGTPGSGPDAGGGARSGEQRPGRGRGDNEGEAGQEGDSGPGSADGGPDDGSVAPGDTDAPGTVEAEQAADEDAEGLTDAAKIGIGGGVLAMLIAGGVVSYRRSLA